MESMELIADKFWGWVNYAYDAYQNHPSGGEPGRRLFDAITPHAIHPIATALLALQEPIRGVELRYKVALVLLFHDLFEDSTKGLPDDLPSEWRDEITRSVQEITFEKGLVQEAVELWEKEPLTILAKLFDKYHSFAEDAPWLIHNRPKEGRLLLDHLRRVATRVQRHFGPLHIIAAVQAICNAYDGQFPAPPLNLQQQLAEVREEIRNR